MTDLAPSALAPSALAPSAQRTGPRRHSHIAIPAFGAFVVGTDAFVIAGLIPGITRTLEIGVGAAGQLMTVFALAYVPLAPVLAALTSGWSRRAVLVTALAVFALGNAATAVATGYELALVSRVIAAAGAALLTAAASATAAWPPPGERRRGGPAAAATMGLTFALALGVPMGTAIGSSMGWRATMWTLTALSLLVLPLIAVRPPDVRQPRTAPRRQPSPLTDRAVWRLLAITVVAFAGICIPYTYISAIFEPSVHDGRLAIVLLVFGVAGAAGTLTAAHLTDRHGPRRVIIIALLALTVVLLMLPAIRDSYAATLPVTAATGFLSFAVTVPQQRQLIALLPAAGSTATSLHRSALYLAIALSAATGALGLDALDSAALPPLAAPFVLAAAGLTWLTGRPSYPPHLLAHHQSGRLASWPRAAARPGRITDACSPTSPEAPAG
ncbi:MFS transporter [Spirillospora sp. NBC_00431]